MNCNMPFNNWKPLWHETLIASNFPSIFPLKLVIINLDWLSWSTASLLPLILSSPLSLAEFSHHGKRTSFIVETINMFPTLLFGCHALLIATLHSILLSPNGLSTDVKIWKNTKFTSIIFKDPQSNTRSCLSKASSSWGADYGFHVWSFTMFSTRAHV